MTRKDDKGDQPSCGETTWTNTGVTRYGRGQHKTVIWRRHSDAFTQPRDTTAAYNDYDDDLGIMDCSDRESNVHYSLDSQRDFENFCEAVIWQTVDSDLPHRR